MVQLYLGSWYRGVLPEGSKLRMTSDLIIAILWIVGSVCTRGWIYLFIYLFIFPSLSSFLSVPCKHLGPSVFTDSGNGCDSEEGR